MAQSKIGSFVEANANVAIGFTINWTANITFLPFLWHADSPKLSALYIGLVFTLISYARQYVLRRWFDGMTRFEAKPVHGSLDELRIERGGAQ